MKILKFDPGGKLIYHLGVKFSRESNGDSLKAQQTILRLYSVP